MPFEAGGRADKFGNRYEGRWVVKQLLRLVEEEISSVILEAVGEAEEGIDLWVKNKDGSRICYQCKARNSSLEYWRMGDLATRNIFKDAKKQLDANENVTYQFVSAVTSMMLNDITNRARNSNDNPNDFYESQILNSGVVVIKAYTNIVKYLELDVEFEADRSRVFEYLKRMYIVQFSDDLETKNTIKGTIKYLFSGSPETIYNLLLNYPIENDLLGKEITPIMLINFLEKQSNISLRNLNNDLRITPRIERLNNEFASSFIEIDNTIIHRKESEKCYEELLSGNSIIIHGKAGSGKSGCVVELLNRLKQENIVHLTLKLDRRVPEYTSDNYGRELGLPSSPVFCLDAVSGDKEAVLILDQLDAIRWTSSHSGTALEVCKEMIAETNNLNKNRDKKLLLVFVCRTFDFQNDNGIKQLFSNLKKSSTDTSWKKIPMSELDDKDVKQVVGNDYASLSTKLKTLLRTPSNLYIWSNLEEKSQQNTYRSSSDLIKEWWNQLRGKCEHIGISNRELNELKEIIVKQINNLGKLMIPEQFVSNCSRIAIDQLLSNGLLLSDNKSIGFVHQSFYDYFLTENMIQQIFEGSSITDIIGPTSEQTPSKRYQLQMILEYLIDYDVDFFIDVGTELMKSTNVRFYMKYAFLEVLGQAESSSRKVRGFLVNYIELDHWRAHLIDAVFVGHPIFIKLLIDEGYLSKWLDTEKDRDLAMMLLRSVNSKLPKEVVSLIYPLAFKGPELDNKLYSVLCLHVTDDSDEMFEFRLELLESRPELLNHHIRWERLVSSAPFRALLILDQIVKNIDPKILAQRHYLDEKTINGFIQIAKDQPHYVWDTFMPFVSESTQNITSNFDPKLDFWKDQQYIKQLYGRTYVRMIKVSASKLIEVETKKFFQNLEDYSNSTSPIVNEILLDVIKNIPFEYSEYAIDWLMEKPHTRLFNYTGNSDEHLFSSKKIIEKHSVTCSYEVFKKLEDTIYYYNEKDELEIARRRFVFNRENRENQKKTLAYWPYWGEVQNLLIPALDPNRISIETFNLKNILSRRFKHNESRHKKSKVISGWVGSTLGEKAEEIDDKQWLRIITKQSEYKREKWPVNKGAFLESSPEQFSKDLERVGKKQPERFARLALKLPEDVDKEYVRAIFNIIGEKETSGDILESPNWKPVKVDIAQNLYLKFGDRENVDVLMSFCRGLENRAEESWDIDIINKIACVAKNHPHPKAGELNVTSSEDPEGKTINSIFTNSMNCVRGRAAETIGALLWEDENRYSYLREAVESVVNDENVAVNTAALVCITPIINIDRKYAVESFFKLAGKDIRIAASPYAYNIFYCLLKDNSKSVRKFVLEMYHSEFEDVAKIGAQHLANMNILYGDFEDFIFNDNGKSKIQEENIIELAINLMSHQEHHEKCKKILMYFLDDKDKTSDSYSQLISREYINIETDIDLLLKIVTTKSNGFIIQRFIDYLNENDIPIKAFRDIIFGLCKNIIENSKRENRDVGSELYGIAPELSKLIAMLYDRTQDDFEINQQCLDMWDEMFENQIGTVRELTQAIMDV